MIKASCPGCQRGIQAPENMAGKRVQCPACKNWLVIPGIPTPVTLPPPPSPPPVRAAVRRVKPEPKRFVERIQQVPAKVWAIGGGAVVLLLLIVLVGGVFRSKPDSKSRVRQGNTTGGSPAETADQAKWLTYVRAVQAEARAAAEKCRVAGQNLEQREEVREREETQKALDEIAAMKLMTEEQRKAAKAASVEEYLKSSAENIRFCDEMVRMLELEKLYVEIAKEAERGEKIPFSERERRLEMMGRLELLRTQALTVSRSAESEQRAVSDLSPEDELGLERKQKRQRPRIETQSDTTRTSSAPMEETAGMTPDELRRLRAKRVDAAIQRALENVTVGGMSPWEAVTSAAGNATDFRGDIMKALQERLPREHGRMIDPKNPNKATIPIEGWTDPGGGPDKNEIMLRNQAAIERAMTARQQGPAGPGEGGR